MIPDYQRTLRSDKKILSHLIFYRNLFHIFFLKNITTNPTSDAERSTVSTRKPCSSAFEGGLQCGRLSRPRKSEACENTRAEPCNDQPPQCRYVLLATDRKEWEFAILLVRLFRSLDSISGGSPETAKAWLQSDNLALAGKKPVELIESTEGLVHVVTYLDASRAIV